LDVQVGLCEDVVQWCISEKRTFLRHRIESKLAGLYLLKKMGSKAMAIIVSLLRELKKLDDKQMLTEVHLLESRIHHILENIPKAKAALTAARTAANSIYVTPLLQAELDEMCGILQCEERDTVTSYSYFLEEFEAYDTAKDSRAVDCLKYMCLSKILGDHAADVPSILSSKNGVKYVGSAGLKAMAAVGNAAKKKSLEEFEAAVAEHASELKTDELIAHHLEILHDQMLEANLLKIIHPFSCVEISHVAKLIKMDEAVVEKKLSQMILDRTFSGILEQGKGHLVVYDSAPEDKSFTHGGEIISNMENVVAALFARAKNMTSKTATTDDKNKKEEDKDKDSAKDGNSAEGKKAVENKKQ
jgi:26S proteasome regulatory subunit N6